MRRDKDTGRPDDPATKARPSDEAAARVAKSREAQKTRAEAAKRKIITARKAKSMSMQATRRKEVAKTQTVVKKQQGVVVARQRLQGRIAAAKAKGPVKRTITKRVTSDATIQRQASTKISTLKSKQTQAVKARVAKAKAKMAEKRSVANKAAKAALAKKIDAAKKGAKDESTETNRGAASNDLNRGANTTADASARVTKATADSDGAKAAIATHSKGLEPLSKPSRAADADAAVTRASDTVTATKDARDAHMAAAANARANAGVSRLPDAPRAKEAMDARKAEADAAKGAVAARQADLDSVARSGDLRKKADDAAAGAKDARARADDANARGSKPEPVAPVKPPKHTPEKDPNAARAKADAITKDLGVNRDTRADLQKKRDDVAAELANAKARAPKAPDVATPRDAAASASAAATKATADHGDAVKNVANAKAARDAAKADLDRATQPPMDPAKLAAHKNAATKAEKDAADARASADADAAVRDKAKREADALKEKVDPPPVKRTDEAALKKERDDADVNNKKRDDAKKEHDENQKKKEEHQKDLDAAHGKSRKRFNKENLYMLGSFPFPLITVFGAAFVAISLASVISPPSRFPPGIFISKRGPDPYKNGEGDGKQDGYAEGYVNGYSDGSRVKSAADSGLRDPAQILEVVKAKMASEVSGTEQAAFCSIKRPLVIAGSLVMGEVYPQCKAIGGAASGSASGAEETRTYSDGYKAGFLAEYPTGYGAGIVAAEKERAKGAPPGPSGPPGPTPYGPTPYGPAPYGAPYGAWGYQAGGEGPGNKVEQYGGTAPAIEDPDENLSESLLTPKDFLYLLKLSGQKKRELRFIESYMSNKLRETAQKV